MLCDKSAAQCYQFQENINSRGSRGKCKDFYITQKTKSPIIPSALHPRSLP